MTGTTLSSDALSPRRRRLLYRAWHRGTREMDLVMGRFADAELTTMADAEVAEFEQLIEVPDPDLFAWLSDREPAPPNYDTPLFRRLAAYHARPAAER
jgi:antitoxin CptB